MPDLDLDLIIPTYNERENIAPLLAELREALAGCAWEALFVDDSDDGTDALIRELAQDDPHIRVLHRSENRDGLAGAVVEGLQQARAPYVCVLDADLQHPPAQITALLAAARRDDADLVVASRYLPGGSDGGLAGPARKLCSRASKAVSRALFPRRLAGLSDPLAGFFVVRRAAIEGVALRPIGYKILLEIVVRARPRRVREVPYTFHPRRGGASKADLRQGAAFVRHLARLTWECSPLCAAPRLLFGAAPAEPAHHTRRRDRVLAWALRRQP